MQAELQAHIAFHLTGRKPRGAFDAHAQSGLRPAVFAGYRDLTALRYDFPLVLIRAAGDRQSLQSLTGLIDGALKTIAAGSDEERVRRHGIRIEQEIRKLAAEGVVGPLSKLWDIAAARPLSKLWDIAAARMGAKTDELLRDSLSRLRAALTDDGEVVDCDTAMPFRLFQHLWQAGQDRKAQKFRDNLNTLIAKLSDILSAEFVRSKEGLSAERLRASVGAAHQSAFDFDVMSRLLADSTVNVPMPESRRQRVRGLLSTLRAQRFYSPAGDGEKGIDVGEPYAFVFEKCSDAVAAYRERLPKMVELAKAIAVARLEIGSEYSEARHDAFFEEFGDNGLDPEQLAGFPDYLICLRAADLSTSESDLLLLAFVAGMPAKIVIQTDDLLEQSPIGSEYVFSGLRSRQLASTAIGLAAYYVLQSGSAGLFRLREQILRGTILSRAGVVQRFLRRKRNRHSALSDRRCRRGIAGFPGFHLRPIGRTGLGIAVLVERQFANRSRLAAAATRL